jgi:hypothetical protein
MQPDQIHQLVASTFAELGAAEPADVSRTLLLRDGRFAGQRFRCGEFEALLSADNRRIEFSDAEGNLRRTVHLEEPPTEEAA